MTDYETEQARSHAQTAKVNAYLYAIVVLAILGIVSIVTVAVVRPHEDNSVLYTTLVGIVAPVTAALLAAMVRDTHVLVNGEMSEFRALIREAAIGKVSEARESGRAEGGLEGIASANMRTDTLHRENVRRLDKTVEVATDTNVTAHRIEGKIDKGQR